MHFNSYLNHRIFNWKYVLSLKTFFFLFPSINTLNLNFQEPYWILSFESTVIDMEMHFEHVSVEYIRLFLSSAQEMDLKTLE